MAGLRPSLAVVLLSGVVSVTAAAQTGPDQGLPSVRPKPAAITENTFGREQTRLLPRSVTAAKGELLAGNPLWTIPLSDLAETRSRPLFSGSRRPPARPVVAALPPPPVKAAPLPKVGPDHPLLTLLGTIVGYSVAIGVFMDETSHDVIRLKSGEAHDGWTLSSVSGRTAVFQKPGYLAATLVFLAPGADANTPSVTGEPVVTGRSGQMTGVPPANPPTPYPIPGSTKGGFKRPAREG
jgi:hypothetical protein